jgi:hypothetical protein
MPLTLQYSAVRTHIEDDDESADEIASTKCCSVIENDDDDDDDDIDDLGDEEFGGYPIPAKKQQIHRIACCCQCLSRTMLILVLISLAMFLSFWASVKWETRQHFMRRGPGPFPKNYEQLVLYKQGLRPDWPRIYQKLPESMISNDPHRKEICFVHIGKSAGSTLSCYFGFLYHRCEAHVDQESHTFVPKIEMAPGKLSKSVTHMIHAEHNDCTHQEFDYYLFVAREPLSRLQSWFTYEYPWDIPSAKESESWKYTKAFFIDCAFGSLNQIGEIGLAGNDENGSTNLTICQRRARNAITGRERYSFHNYHNYGYYQYQVEHYHNDTSNRTLVIRSEHLESDWQSIERVILNGEFLSNASSTFQHTNASPKRPQDSVLSDVARLRICRYLCYEIQIYKRLLQSALNLKASDVEVSMQELRERCPIEAASTVCNIDEAYQQKTQEFRSIT